MVEIDHEEFLTIEDVLRSGQKRDDIDLEKINGYSSVDSEDSGASERFLNRVDESDPDFIGYLENGTPRYKTESNYPNYNKELTPEDEAAKIMWVFRQKKEELKKIGDHRHILLLKKGTYIQGYGKDSKYIGKLENHALAIFNKEHKDEMNFLFSFNPKGSDIFLISYKSRGQYFDPLEKREVYLNPKIKIKGDASHLDLNKAEYTSVLRNLLAKR